MTAQQLKLPAGLLDADGACHRQVEIEPLCGRDEELVAGTSAASGAAVVSTLLARCVTRIGDLEPIDEDQTRALLVADRQFLLLRLRALTFGPRVDADLACAWPDCGRMLSVTFSIDDIPVEVPEPIQAAYSIRLPTDAVFRGPDGDLCEELHFRLPNGGDEEAVAELARTDPASAATRLMERCLRGHGMAAPQALVDCFTPRARAALEAEMARIAPRLETTIETRCPECGREVGVPLDITELFLGDLRISTDLLRREVHYLAFHYHWSEAEIMAMPRGRRRDYIRVLADEIERMNDAT